MTRGTTLTLLKKKLKLWKVKWLAYISRAKIYTQFDSKAHVLLPYVVHSSNIFL